MSMNSSGMNDSCTCGFPFIGGQAVDEPADSLLDVAARTSLPARRVVVLTSLIAGLLLLASAAPANAAKAKPHVRTVELHLRNDGAVALRIRVRHVQRVPGPEVFAFRPRTGLVTVAHSTPKPRLWRIGPNTQGADNLLDQLQRRVDSGGTPAVMAGAKGGGSKRFEITEYDSRVRGHRT
jgi:hypothetical protein